MSAFRTLRASSSVRDQLPLVGAALVDECGAILEERLKGSADGGLMGDTKRAELRERLMVSADALVIRFQGKRAHAAQLVPERERGDNFSMPAAGRSGYESDGLVEALGDPDG